MIIPFISLLLPAVASREAKSIYNIAHVLSKVSKVIDKCRAKKEKETKSTIKLHLSFMLDGM